MKPPDRSGPPEKCVSQQSSTRSPERESAGQHLWEGWLGLFVRPVLLLITEKMEQ